VTSCIAYFLEATGKRFTAAVERLPDGVYESEEWLDPNGADAEARLHVRLSVAGGRLNFDFSESAPQLTGSSRNVPRNAVLATVYAIAKSMLDPDVPPNSGYFDRIVVTTHPGTLLDPTPPAAYPIDHLWRSGRPDRRRIVAGGRGRRHGR
jgi:N-methylhydantoinase B